MLDYLYYRFVRFREEFEKDNRVDVFALYYMSTNLRNIKNRGDKIREEIRATASERARWRNECDSLEKEANLLKDAEFHTVATKYRRLLLVLVLIALGESGLNYFTAMIAIPAAGVLAGGVGDALRLSAALMITLFGIFGAEQLFDEVLPTKKYGEDIEAARAKQRLGASWVRAVLWGAVLVGTEYMVYHFGLVRVRDIEGGRVDPDIVKSIIVLSMIVPVVGGGLSWELSNIRDSYKNRIRYDRYRARISRADTNIETLLILA